MELLSIRRIIKEAAVALVVATLIEAMVVAFLMTLDLEADRSMHRFSVTRQAAAPSLGRSAPDVCANASIPTGNSTDDEQ